jgi:Xaa-Pro aminopeptidase
MRALSLSCVVLAAVLGRSAAAQDVPLFTSDFPPEEFKARRAAIMDAIGTDAIALVQGAGLGEAYARFRQSNEFYYLCGVETPNAYLLIDGGNRRTTLYLPHRNERREASEGKVLSAEDAEQVVKLTGVDAVAGLDLLGEQAVMEQAAAQMDRILADTPFSSPAHAEAAKAFVAAYHESAKRGGLGHWVGMSTHDVGQDAVLRPGMVFTIEPQLRVPEEKGYFRLEDLIVIGETKAEVVSEWLPTDIDAIEKVMREPGLLQSYPRDASDPAWP